MGIPARADYPLGKSPGLHRISTFKIELHMKFIHQIVLEPLLDLEPLDEVSRARGLHSYPMPLVV